MSSNEFDVKEIRIGSSAYGGTQAAPKEKVVRGKSAVNAANRAGGVTAVKKYGTANQGSNTGGQHLTKVDREDAPTGPPKIPSHIASKIAEMRKRSNNPWLEEKRDEDMTQKDLAQLCNIPKATMTAYENGSAPTTGDYVKHMNAIERNLNVFLLSKEKFGQPKFAPKSSKK